MPKRVQMHRRKGGWRKDHPDAVIVDRSTKWGNPFAVEKTLCEGSGRAFTQTKITDRRAAVKAFQKMMAIEERNYPSVAEIQEELGGKDLACWCPLDQPCHADVLLRIANDERLT